MTTREEENSQLSLVNNLERKLTLKIEKLEYSLSKKIDELTSKLEATNTKFDHAFDKQNENKLKMEKIESLLAFQNKANDMLTTHEIRINNAIKDLENAKYKYDKIFIDNLTVPGYIGEFCTFKTMRDYIDNNIKEMSSLNQFKNKSDMDLKEYKTKLESLIKQFTQSLNQFSSQQIAYANGMKKETMKYVDDEIKIINDKVQDLRLENTKEGIRMKEKTEELLKEKENVIALKEELKKSFKDDSDNLKIEFNNAINNFNEFKREYLKIKSRFIELIEFIKDVRFRRNLVDFNGIKKREIKGLVDKIEFKKRKKEEINLDKPLDLDYDVFTGEKEVFEDEEEDTKNATENKSDVKKTVTTTNITSSPKKNPVYQNKVSTSPRIQRIKHVQNENPFDEGKNVNIINLGFDSDNRSSLFVIEKNAGYKTSNDFYKRGEKKNSTVKENNNKIKDMITKSSKFKTQEKTTIDCSASNQNNENRYYSPNVHRRKDN